MPKGAPSEASPCGGMARRDGEDVAAISICPSKHADEVLIPHRRVLIFYIVEIIFVKKFGKGDACAFTKALHGDHLGAFCSALDQIVNGRRGHAALERGITNIDSLFLTNLMNTLDNGVVQLHHTLSFIILFVEFHNYYMMKQCFLLVEFHDIDKLDRLVYNNRGIPRNEARL